MILINSLSAWQTVDFQDVVKLEIEKLDTALLPLQQGLTHGSHVTDDPVNVVILGSTSTEDSICVKAGIFYKSVIAGCSCADDPTPIDTNQEYCELEFTIDKNTGEATVSHVKDS